MVKKKKKALIVFPSVLQKADRTICSSQTEWECWGFYANDILVWRFGDYRLKKGNFISLYEEKEVTSLEGGALQPVIFWVKECEEKGKEAEFKCHVENLISFLEKFEYELHIAYHSPSVAGIIPNQYPQICYSLVDKRFESIKTKDDTIDHTDSFENIFSCFFSYEPDIFQFTFHKLNGLMSPLDIDLQGWIESGFDDKLLDKTKDTYFKEIRKSFLKRFFNIDGFIKELINVLQKLLDDLHCLKPNVSIDNEAYIIIERHIGCLKYTIESKDQTHKDPSSICGSSEQKMKDFISLIGHINSENGSASAKEILKHNNCFRVWHEEILRLILKLQDSSAPPKSKTKNEDPELRD